MIGQFQAQVVSGRRIAVPKHFRKELGGTFIIARWYEECTVLVSQRKWDALLSRLRSGDSAITRSVRDTDRFVMAGAFEVSPDSQGRIVVPKILSEHARIDKECVFIGLGERAELWDERKWMVKEKLLEKSAGELLEKVAQDAR